MCCRAVCPLHEHAGNGCPLPALLHQLINIIKLLMDAVLFFSFVGGLNVFDGTVPVLMSLATDTLECLL